ncbi:MAG: YchJ family metal-binding protein [Anaerolineae bacterium]|nr:YchJ family metal-binding protein [Anaerolineae bacterium]
MSAPTNQMCPCGSGLDYSGCCLPLHRGSVAPSAEAVMRARYAAYASGSVSYLLKSIHPDSPQRRSDVIQWRRELHAVTTQTRFVRLRILFVDDSSSAEMAFVTFRVTAFQGTLDVSFGERSEFRLRNGRWLYFDGVMLPSSGSIV